jgi:hypothetical protein
MLEEVQLRMYRLTKGRQMPFLEGTLESPLVFWIRTGADSGQGGAVVLGVRGASRYRSRLSKLFAAVPEGGVRRKGA